MQACFCFDRESVELPSKGQNSLLVVPWTLNWLLFDEETWEARRRERICWVRRYSESLFHVLKLYNLSPFFPTLFSTAPQNEGDLPLIAQNARIAFCGNGFIHLNIAEIHEDIIGDQKR